MNKTYDITLRCNLDQLPTILQVIQGHALLLSCQQTAGETEPPSSGSHKPFRYTNGQRNKGISGRDLFLRCITEGKTSRPQIVQAFISAGFSPNSFSPVFSKLLASGEVRETDGHVHPIVQTQQEGAPK